MDDSSLPRPDKAIDYQAAAERLLVALSSIAQKFPNRPIPAVKLAFIFDREVRRHWQRETLRRRIRDTAEVARAHIRRQHGLDGKQILSAGGRGYWMTDDPHIITWYAAQRRRSGLTALRASSQTKRTLLAQPSLFTEGVHACS